MHKKKLIILCELLTAVLLAKNASAQLITLATFTGANGEEPYGNLVADSSGDLFGTTLSGGSLNNLGEVFEISAAGVLTTTPCQASALQTQPQYPEGGLISDGSGNFYGASTGGAKGTIYLYSPSSQTLTTLATLSSTTGTYPYDSLTADSSGNLYGTANEGGAYGPTGPYGGYGTIFEVAAGTHAVTALASFDGTNGANPYSNLVADSSGNLYGTTYNGGAFTIAPNYFGGGTVFKYNHATGTISDLVSFNVTDGSGPIGGLVWGSDGNLYGTTQDGGTIATSGDGEGTIFKVNPLTGALTTLFVFNGTTGGGPYAGLISDGNGGFYGTTWSGGANNDGTVFDFNPTTLALTTLYSFSGLSDGRAPYGGLLLMGSNLYGTTSFGGASDDGTVYELMVPEPATLCALPLALLALPRSRNAKHLARSEVYASREKF